MKTKTLLNLMVFSVFCFFEKANAQGGTLPLNGSINGNLTSSVADVWNITTTSDGLLRFTFHAVNPADLYLTLYDNNGTTAVSVQVESYNNSTVILNVDGLAAGSYHAKITPYSTAYGSYTLADSLFTPTQANDVEPNGSKATALTLAVNKSKTGHVGFYYNNQRDTADWYKVTTTADGLLRVSLTCARSSSYSNNPLDVNVWLYDNNGATQLGYIEVYNGGNPATGIFNVDGLAAGTYYIKVQDWNPSTEFAAYTLTDSLFTPALANDVEPNGSRASALTLPLNGSKIGHVGYYYNNQRDTADWYKVTTTADGLLRVSLTAARGSTYSVNPLDVNVWLYDNDGTTQLGYVEVYNGGDPGTATITTDGLEPGTYYIRVQDFNNTEFADYTVGDSLFVPAQANDKEPNYNIAKADTLVVNKTTTGHIGYYYNNQRDTSDWYKITTKADGMLRFTLTTARSSSYSNNPLDVTVWLYDNNGSTQLGYVEVYNGNNPSTGVLKVDRLSAGTYYIKVQDWNTSTEFADYTISDSLFTYNANDKEPDNNPYQAKTIPANGTATGHISFYFNGGITTDYVDWHKVNYTGTGNLQFNVTLLPHLLDGGIGDIFFQVYKDTAASPIFNQEFYSYSMHTFTLTSLTQGYYWIKILPYNSNPSYFTAYSITDSFTQVNIAAVKATSYDTAASCSSINTITFSCSNSSPPYSVKLYRYGALYSTKTAKVKNVSFDSLPPGVYYARAFGDGATGTANGKSKNVGIVPIPGSPFTTAITATQATLNWTAVSCANFDSIYYRVHGTTNWSKRNTPGNPASFILTGLTASTTYDWKVAAVDSANGIIAAGAFSGIVVFATPAAIAGGVTGQSDDALKIAGTDRLQLVTIPNPATSSFKIKFGSAINTKVTAVLFDISGRSIWSSGAIEAFALNGKQVNTNQFAGGTYLLQIVNDKGQVIGKTKVVIDK